MIKYGLIALVFFGGIFESTCAACDLSDDVVKTTASNYIISKYAWGAGDFELRVSVRGRGYSTVVASHLPISPGSAVILTIECRPTVVRDISSAPNIEKALGDKNYQSREEALESPPVE